MQGMSGKTRGLSDTFVSINASHARYIREKGLQRQKGDGTLVSSQERRAADVPRINRGSNAGQPVIVFHHSVCIVFRLFVIPWGRSGQLFTMPWGAKGLVVSWANRPVGVRSCPVPPRRPALRRAKPFRPWYVRVLDSAGSCKASPGNSAKTTNKPL